MSNPQIDRLNSELKKVKTLIEASGGSLRLVSTRGTPPTSYTIEYHCPSPVQEQGRITTRNSHQVEINLGSNYPFGKPSARMLTPVFNPHVFTSNAICLGGVWNPGETLDLLILRIGALLQLDPKVLDANSPANYEANIWVKNNRSRIPFGNVTFTGPTISPAKRIQWH